MDGDSQKKDKYNRMFSDYLVDCCLYYELACQRISDEQFDRNAAEIAANWDHIDHHHKHLVDIEALKKSSSGIYITFPTIIRSIACRLAQEIPGSPMWHKPYAFVNAYCVDMIGKNTNV